jgi:hypothetical protein
MASNVEITPHPTSARCASYRVAGYAEEIDVFVVSFEGAEDVPLIVVTSISGPEVVYSDIEGADPESVVRRAVERYVSMEWMTRH